LESLPSYILVRPAPSIIDVARKEKSMAEERDNTHDPVSGRGTQDGDRAERDQRATQAASPGSGASPAFPASEADYWREVYAREAYYEAGRNFEDYGPAYEFGWASYAAYGDAVEIADRLLASDWEQRRGISSLSWDQARPAARAAWRRAENARSVVTDGSAPRERVIETLNDLLENARDGELAFREAAEHTKTPRLSTLFRRRAETCAEAATELQAQLRQLGGRIEEGGTLTGAVHRIWVHIRGLFGGASDETMLHECERGEDAGIARYRKALQQNLPHDIHAMVLRQFEEAQRNHDMIKTLRDQARAENKRKTDDDT
jgi:uncharacterized protein (TIGR02284 family)